MSHLTYNNYPGFGQQLSDTTHYSQAVRIPGNPSLIKCSGQGGWDPETGAIEPPTSKAAIETQVAQAFSNVDLTLRNAGSKRGWSDVYLARIYFVDLETPGLFEKTVECMKQWCPDHRPVVTGVTVQGLALEGMRIEIEVEACDGESS